MSALEATSVIAAECVECRHVWIVVYAPMILSVAAEVAKRTGLCPKCGADKPVVAQTGRVAQLIREGAIV